MEKTKQSRRINLIINYLSTRRQSHLPTIDEIVDYVNQYAERGKGVSQRTVDRDLSVIRKQGIRIDTKLVNGKYVYILDKSDELPLIDEEDKQDLGVLLRLINTHEELKSVQWLKSMLISDYGMREDHFKNDKYFVYPKLLINDHDKILKLAMELVRYAKTGTVVQFYYLPINPGEPIQLRTVAPMQVRQYDGRYYLAAVNWDENAGPSQSLFIYSLDKFQDQVVSPAVNETDDDMESEEMRNLHFDHHKLATRVGLKNYFDHCIGVTRLEGVDPKEIRLKFTDWARTHVKNNPIHQSQRIVEDGEVLIITIYVYDTFELKFVLARYREYCERLN